MDKCAEYIQSTICKTLPSIQHHVALINEILVPEVNPHIASHICLQRMDFAPELHETLKIPRLILSDAQVIATGKVGWCFMTVSCLNA
jgi:hypothetical protein